jgi:hypothetical protein
MAEQEHPSSRTPLLAVDTGALIRMWRFIIEAPQTRTPPACVAYDIRLVQDQVGLGKDDAISVFFRTSRDSTRSVPR